MTEPLVSVHIISYNQKDFIRSTIDSVLSQTYENVEIVVADDGSFDGTAEIISSYARRHPGKVIGLTGGPNLGITGNSNRGLVACTGKYIAFLGGDDLMGPDKIERQVELMEADEACSICYHDLDVFDDATDQTIHLHSSVSKPHTGDVRVAIREGCFNGGSSTMVRTSDIPTAGFDQRMPVASDWCFWIETLLSRGGTIRYIPDVLGRYRQHANNITRVHRDSPPPGLRDHFDTCMKIVYDHPEYARDAYYRSAALLRGLRHWRNYTRCLLESLRISIQWKTVALLAVHISSLGRVRR